MLFNNRGTGRTTRMLVNAVYESQIGKVAIIGHSDYYSRELAREAKAMCSRLGLNPENIVLRSPQNGRAKEVTQTFYDHYYKY